MATKRIEITNEWKLINNGGETASVNVLLKLKSGVVFLGTTTTNTNPPAEEDCFLETDGIAYTGGEYLWAKTPSNTKAIAIIDKL